MAAARAHSAFGFLLPLVTIVSFIIGLALWGAVLIFFVNSVRSFVDDGIGSLSGGGSGEEDGVAVLTTDDCDRLAEATELTEEEAAFLEESCVEPTPTPEPEPAVDRFDCDMMRGAPYESPGERTWFLANCITPTP